MEHTKNTIPRKRITSIDALRGFALIGICLWHCMEHFDLGYFPQHDSPFWQQVDNVTFATLQFLFQGKAYAIFSLLFGLSFFIQMDSQADKGMDFRLRFAWRLFLLVVLGYLNGLFYMGEFFLVYGILGFSMLLLHKVSTRWLIIIAIILLMQIPGIYQFISLLNNNVPNEPNSSVVLMNQLFDKTSVLFVEGSFGEVIRFNTFWGQLAKSLWVINNYRYIQLIGLFVVGMLIGRYNIHRDEEKMIRYSRKLLPYTIAWTAFFYCVIALLPSFGVEGFAFNRGKTLFMSYANLGFMMFYICGITLLYYKTQARKTLDVIAPVGRMSVTNYMMQGLIGTFIFYGYGLNAAVSCSLFHCFLIGLAMVAFQILFSNWWIRRYYYGPVEWLWRIATWLKKVPLRRS